MSEKLTRRRVLESAAAVCAGGLIGGVHAAQPQPNFTLATFVADVTPSLGHPLMGGGIMHAARIDDPLFARGIVLGGAGSPIVIVGVDWCEIRNDAYARWREALAQAAGTVRERVLVSCLHQHDAPVADLRAEAILRQHGAQASICDPEFHEQAVASVARAVAEAVKTPERLTHVGTATARVEKVASNRRYEKADGTLSFGRTSACREPRAHEAPEGTVDPWLKTLSFWNEDRSLAAVSFYATHPMSYYGQGGVSSDFVGLARRRRAADEPRIHQMYLSGASGNVTAGKYNDGSPPMRVELADRIYRAMVSGWDNTKRRPLETIQFRAAPLHLEPRDTPGFTAADLRERVASDTRPFGRCLAALGLSWRERVERGQALDVPVVDFGFARLLQLPAESYVEYQLLAQRLGADSFVAVAGYGECAPGYIPTERSWDEDDTNLRDWCWVARGAEARLTEAITAVLKPHG